MTILLKLRQYLTWDLLFPSFIFPLTYSLNVSILPNSSSWHPLTILLFQLQLPDQTILSPNSHNYLQSLQRSCSFLTVFLFVPNCWPSLIKPKCTVMVLLTAGPRGLSSFSATRPSTNMVANQGAPHAPGSTPLQDLNPSVYCLTIPLTNTTTFPVIPLLLNSPPILEHPQWCSSYLIAPFILAPYSWPPVLHFISRQPKPQFCWKTKETSTFCFSIPALRKLGNDGKVIGSLTNACNPLSNKASDEI